MNVQTKTTKIVLAGLMAALTCIATMLIRIPTIKGYIHIGDCMVIASGILLGPVAGALAAGIGSMLADLLGGYYVFSIATFVIKFAAAFAAGVVFKAASKVLKKYTIPLTALSGLASGIIVTVGYFVFEIFYGGIAYALAEILPNCIQGLAGMILSALLVPILLQVPIIRDSRLTFGASKKSA